MKCPFCEHHETRVHDSRETDDNTTIRRRRECAGCNRRFTTYERYEEAPVVVVKKDMRRERFERAKVLSGIHKACEKRPISSAQKEALVNTVERELRQRGESEISSVEIGDMVMRYLKRLDPVAYVRFASVYKDFQDLEKFAEELRQLQHAPHTAAGVRRGEEASRTTPNEDDEGGLRRRRPKS
ncbi:MAG: transcriptional repressor NrdR [Proteobacteria bacterium]|nr:transcriptional repressor NrdR [Pseudomonadota bacterium]